MRWVAETFADRHTEIEDLFATEDRVVARVRFSATQAGELTAYRHRPLFEAEQVHIWASRTACRPSTGCSATTLAPCVSSASTPRWPDPQPKTGRHTWDSQPPY